MPDQPAKKAPAARLDCQTCGKNFANQKNLNTHVDKAHKDKTNIEPAEETNDADEVPGTSSENDNDSAATTFNNTEEDLQAENEMMEEFAKQLDLLESIKDMTQNDIQYNEQNDLKNAIGEKLERFKTIVEKKHKVIKEAREDNLKLKHEVECSKQVEKNLTKDLGDKDKEVDCLKKNLKTEKDNSTAIIAEARNKKKEIQRLKQVIEARNKEIKELQDNVNPPDVVEITNTPVQMNKESSGPICLPCDRRFVSERDLENHINAKHQPKICPLCDEAFKNKLNLISHINMCMDTNGVRGPPVKCVRCKKNFNKDDLKKHNQNGSCTQQNKNIICRNCNAVCISQADLRKHMKDDHDEENSREVCKHWKAGNCFKGDQCKFAHVGHRSGQVLNSTRRDSMAPCRNGRECAWLQRGRCNFGHSEQRSQGHSEQRSQGMRQSQEGRSGNQIRSEQMCWLNQNCTRNFCRYKHTTVTDFPNLTMNQNQRPQVWNNSRQ